MTETASMHEDPADERQQQFLLDDDRDGADRAAERERAHVAHEYLGRMGVVPEESDARAHHGPAEHRQFRRPAECAGSSR